MLAKQKERLRELSATDLKKLVYELGTHQIELEMQNEELRHAQTELESSRRKYADLYDFSPMGYFTFDKNGLIREVNHTGAGMLGMEKRFLVGKPLQNFIGPDGRTAFRDHLTEVFRTGTRQTCEIDLNRKDGVLFPAQLQSIGADSGEGTIDSCRTAVSDISERKKAEEALRTAHTELERRAYELEALNRELEAFSYTVSHDLKAPLRSIEGFTRAILEDYAEKLDETGRDYLTRVHSASQRMSHLIEAMLNMARLTRGAIQEKTVDLSSLAQVTAHEIRKQATGRQVEFIIQKNVKAKGDQDMLQVMLENLLDNAWKFTSAHATAKIEFGTTNMDGKTVYFVRDDGAGFDMAFSDKLFKPFKRLHTESEFPGIGIGLAIAHRIILRHNGRLWAESAPEKGATFFFTL
jgi:PAS domain S-box-containing protein